MATRYHNISGETTTELFSSSDSIRTKSISIVNKHASTKCTVDLYAGTLSTPDSTVATKYYFLKGVELPVGVTLEYDFKSNDSIGQLGLYIKLTKSDIFTLTGSIDVTGTNTNVPGTNTLYLSELAVGDEITVTGETRTIATITSDTAATVTAAWGSDLANDTTPDCSPKSKVDVILS